MFENPRSQGWKRLLPLALVALLAQLSQAKDLFGDLTRPIVLFLLNTSGVAASDRGDILLIGGLEIPWSRDCAGLNLLIILLAVAVWVNRNEVPGFRYWARLALMVPAALVANIARIFTIIGYRHFFYPDIESQQLHYFFGLLWLVPFAILAMPKESRSRPAMVFEFFHAASVIALLSPMVDGPGGIGLSAAVVFSLAHCRLPGTVSRLRLVLFAAWLIAAAAIMWAGVESFWMPWLLVCPLLADPAWVLRPAGGLLILASHPMFALVPGGEMVTWLAVGMAAWKMFNAVPAARLQADGGNYRGAVSLCMGAGALAFVLPFLSSGFSDEGRKLLPPAGAAKKEVPGSGYQLHMPGQSEDIGLFWYMPSGRQRHHTLRVCMKYRGIDLRPSGEDPDVMTDGDVWMREFFIQDGRLLDTHLAYVRSTMGPGKSPGVHLIFVAMKASMDARAFDEAARQIASGLINPGT